MASQPVLEVKASRLHGRGVFCASGAAVGQVLERCPVLVVPSEELEYLDRTVLNAYYYGWEDDAGAVALGFGSLYNHAGEGANADYVRDAGDDVIEIVAIRDIRPGEEVTIDYTRAGAQELWFDPS